MSKYLHEDDFLMLSDDDEYQTILEKEQDEHAKPLALDTNDKNAPVDVAGDGEPQQQQNETKPVAEDDNQPPGDVVADANQAGSAVQEQGKVDAATYSSELSTHQIKFCIKGTTSWNTREPYVIAIDFNQLQQDANALDHTFYILEQPVDDRTILNSLLRVEAKKYIFNKGNLTDKYMLYIFKNIIKQIDVQMENFAIPEKYKKLLSYHLGPQTIYNLITTEFKMSKFGYCYKLMRDQRIIQFLPLEFIKKAILIWFEENVNVFNLDFDNVNYFDMLRSYISNKYQQQYKKLQIKIYEKKMELSAKGEKEPLQISKREFFGEKNIIVYKRFVPRTIF